MSEPEVKRAQGVDWANGEKSIYAMAVIVQMEVQSSKAKDDQVEVRTITISNRMHNEYLEDEDRKKIEETGSAAVEMKERYPGVLDAKTGFANIVKALRDAADEFEKQAATEGGESFEMLQALIDGPDSGYVEDADTEEGVTDPIIKDEKSDEAAAKELDAMRGIAGAPPEAVN